MILENCFTCQNDYGKLFYLPENCLQIRQTFVRYFDLQLTQICHYVVYNSDMELANPIFNKALTRQLHKKDRSALTWFLRSARYSHVHVDWYALSDWLGQPAAVGLEIDGELQAFLVAGADPPPAAWVRGVALQGDQVVEPALQRLLQTITPALRAAQATHLAWMSSHRWPDPIVAALGFETLTHVVTMTREIGPLPAFALNPAIRIRPVVPADMETLAQIEEDAFAPLWRYSARALMLAHTQTFSFDVALLDGVVVGYQCSTASYYGAHLARMTVAPAAQRLGVGTALLTHAIAGYRRGHLQQLSLNTQTDNVSSHFLYRKFGYHETSERLPVWVLPL